MVTARKSAPKVKPGASAKLPSGENAALVHRDIAAAADKGFHFYVYTLSDAAGVFYVGKGTRQRIFQHERNAYTDPNAVKSNRVIGCGSAGPTRALVAFFREECDAYLLESEMIAAGRETLTNIASGTIGWRQNSIETARRIMARIVPFDQWCGRYGGRNLPWCTTPRETYDSFVAEVQKQIDNPCPTEIVVRHPVELRA